VPVIMVRGVPAEMLLAAAAAGKLQASVQFPRAAPVDLPCVVDAVGLLCAPRDEAAPALAAAFIPARSMTVGMSVSVAGSSPLFVKDRSLALAGTQEALARLGAAGAPSTAPSGWPSLLDRALKAMGYRHGTADLPALLLEYLRR
jgi:hypothetical protein